jgi:hypothetical protein
VQHGIFVALSRQEVHTDDISRVIRPSTTRPECSEERENEHGIRLCEPHR